MGFMEPMKWQPFLKLCLAMILTGLFFKYLSSRPEHLAGGVIVSVRRIAEARSMDSSVNAGEDRGDLDASVGRLERYFDKVRGEQLEEARVMALLLELLKQERERVASIAADLEKVSAKPEELKRGRRYMEAALPLLDLLLRDYSMRASRKTHRPPELMDPTKSPAGSPVP